MSYYYNTETGVREIDADLYAAWVANGNPKADYWTPIPDPPSPQARWDGTQWVEPPPYKPQSCTPRQIRQALNRTGDLRQQVEAAVAAGDQDLKDWWEFSTTIERMHPQVLVMAELLQQTPEQLDALFELAISL